MEAFGVDPMGEKQLMDGWVEISCGSESRMSQTEIKQLLEGLNKVALREGDAHIVVDKGLPKVVESYSYAEKALGLFGYTWKENRIPVVLKQLVECLKENRELIEKVPGHARVLARLMGRFSKYPKLVGTLKAWTEGGVELRPLAMWSLEDTTKRVKALAKKARNRAPLGITSPKETKPRRVGEYGTATRFREANSRDLTIVCADGEVKAHAALLETKDKQLLWKEHAIADIEPFLDILYGFEVEVDQEAYQRIMKVAYTLEDEEIVFNLSRSWYGEESLTWSSGTRREKMMELAAANDDLKLLEFALFKAEGDKLARSELLEIAVDSGCCQIVSYLLNELGYRPLDFDKESLFGNKFRYNWFDSAVEKGHVDVARVLKDVGFSTWLSEDTMKAIVRDGRLDLLRLLPKKTWKRDFFEGIDSLILIRDAVDAGHDKVVRFLVEKRLPKICLELSQINQCLDNGLSPIPTWNLYSIKEEISTVLDDVAKDMKRYQPVFAFLDGVDVMLARLQGQYSQRPEFVAKIQEVLDSNLRKENLGIEELRKQQEALEEAEWELRVAYQEEATLPPKPMVKTLGANLGDQFAIDRLRQGETDVTIVCRGNKEVPAHSLFLSELGFFARSDDWGKPDKINLEDYSQEAVSYIIDVLSGMPLPAPKDIDAEMKEELLDLANYLVIKTSSITLGALYLEALTKGMPKLEKGETWTGRAAETGNKKLLELLCVAGALDSSTLHKQHTPLSWAVWKGHTDAVRFLLEQGASPHRHEDERFGPMHQVAAREQPAVEILKLLVGYGGKLDERTKSYERTPLMLAAQRGSFETAFQLLELGADPTLQTWAGRTATSYALERRPLNVEIYDLIAMALENHE